MNYTITVSLKVYTNHYVHSTKRVFSKNAGGVEKAETTFNYRIIWPIIDAVVDMMDDEVTFLPGELNLKSFDDLDMEYKADGAGFVKNHEILLLETSGAYGNTSAPRWAYNHVKGTFGTLSMLRALVRKYSFASMELLQRCRIWFMHVRGLWFISRLEWY